MSDPKLMQEIKEAEEEIKKGEFLTIEELEAKLGLANTDESEIDTDQTNFDPIEEMKGFSGKQLMKDIKEAEEQYERGEFTDWEDFKKELFPKD